MQEKELSLGCRELCDKQCSYMEIRMQGVILYWYKRTRLITLAWVPIHSQVQGPFLHTTLKHEL